MIFGNKIRLRDKKIADATSDYAWHTDLELAQLDAVPPVTATFLQYLPGYARELDRSSPTRHPLAIETLEGKHIGNCVYYGIDEIEGEAEVGILIGDRNYWDKGYGTDAVTTLVNYIFRETNLNRLYLKTLEGNYRAQKCFEKCGFTRYGHTVRDGFRFVLMEIHRNQRQERQTET